MKQRTNCERDLSLQRVGKEQRYLDIIMIKLEGSWK